MMKKFLFTGLVAILLMSACKKDYTAAFNTSSSNYYLYQTVTFNNTSTGGSSNWDFGDGTTSTTKSPTHSYNQPGNYTVTLTDGSSVATKALTVYHGSAAFQVVNQLQESFALFTCNFIDASNTSLGYPINYIDQGTIAAGGSGTIYYTTDSTVYLGGTLPGTDTTFLVAPPHFPYTLTKNTLNSVVLGAGTLIYKLDNLTGSKPTVQNIRTNFSRPKQALRLSPKHTAQ